MAQLAIEAGSPGEAQRILEKGFAANVFTDARVKEQATRACSTPPRRLPPRTRPAWPRSKPRPRRAKTGDADVARGQRLPELRAERQGHRSPAAGSTKGGVQERRLEAQLAARASRSCARQQGRGAEDLPRREGRSEARALANPGRCTLATGSSRWTASETRHDDQGR